jgi:hypothetical protein
LTSLIQPKPLSASAHVISLCSLQVHKERFRKYTLDDGVVFEPSASQLQKALEGVVVAISATLGAVPRLITEPRFAHFWVTTGGKPAYTQLTALVRERVWVRVGEYLRDVKEIHAIGWG